MQNNKTTNLKKIQDILRLSSTVVKEQHTIFYKTGAGEYAEHDKFLGVKTPTLRQIAKNNSNLTSVELKHLIKSEYNEERLLVLFILINQYKKSDDKTQEKIYRLYLANLRHINNWNLVDASAHYIIGAHLLAKDKDLLLTLAKSKSLWEKRIAIVATWYFIRNNKLNWTFKIAQLLLTDKNDLIHKATGWMLREAGKKNLSKLIAFLDQYHKVMPRTMLRYAIERLPKTKKEHYL